MEKVKMIKISDLRRIKRLCFDKIAANGTARRGLAVQIKPLNDELYTVIMSNGVDYARLVADFIQPAETEEINIAWTEFARICDFFDKTITITNKNGMYEIKEGKTKFKCAISRSEANNNCYFKFDFDNAIKISMDDCFVLIDRKMQMNKFALDENMLMSTDGIFATINYLKQDFGTDIRLFTEKFPSGMWYFNPKQRIIVSEDKKVACSFSQATGGFPFEAVKKLVKQPLSNWLEVDAKQLKEVADKCSKIDDKIILQFAENEVIVSANNREQALDFAVPIPAEYNHKSTRLDIRFLDKYLTEFYRCIDENGKLKIFFDDNQSTYMTRCESKNLSIFGMSLMPPHLMNKGA